MNFFADLFNERDNFYVSQVFGGYLGLFKATRHRWFLILHAPNWLPSSFSPLNVITHIRWWIFLLIYQISVAVPVSLRFLVAILVCSRRRGLLVTSTEVTTAWAKKLRLIPSDGSKRTRTLYQNDGVAWTSWYEVVIFLMEFGVICYNGISLVNAETCIWAIYEPCDVYSAVPFPRALIAIYINRRNSRKIWYQNQQQIRWLSG